MKEIKVARQRNITDLRKDIQSCCEKLVALRFEREAGSLKKVHEISVTKKKIARFLYLIREYDIQQSSETVDQGKK
ncbi:MAG: 50S ribosomal protein L29 [Candidatus Paceibacterota bacterium]|jgi:ribosomal protein L29